MFDTILAALDRSPANRKVFDKALSLAKANQASLILLHVLSGEEPDSPIMSHYPAVGDHHHYLHLDPTVGQMANEMYRRQWNAFKAQGVELLRSFANEAITAGVPTEFSQLIGHPSLTICDFAQTCHAKVILIGSRGYSGWKELFLGSVSNYVVHHTPCSILLVRTAIEPQGDSALENVESTALA
ncbi:universal stress protein [Myxosarcina sp. GI1(2024)]